MSYSKRKKDRMRNFIAIGRDMLFGSPEWKKLSGAAKLLYITLKGKYNGFNNGDLRLHYSELKGVRGLSSSSTVAKAFKELEDKGWIVRVGMGGLHRHPNRYELTGKFDSRIPVPGKGMAYYKKPSDFKAYEPPEPLRKSKTPMPSQATIDMN